MMLLRIPRLPRRLTKVTIGFLPFHFASRRCLVLLLVLVVAALLEVWIHTRQFVVQQPEQELDEPFYTSCQEPAVEQAREKAALVMLARNTELEGALKTVMSIERHFNRWFHYPIVFLNDEPWADDFVSAIKGSASGEVSFHVIPHNNWTFPDWIDVKVAKQRMAAQGKSGVQYGGLESYHHMCRFYSGHFFTLDALKAYNWYWRIEPDVDFYCSITYDPFVEMAKHDKVYGFAVATWDSAISCSSLFRELSDWKEKHRIPTTDLWRAVRTPSWVPWPFRSWMRHFRIRDSAGDIWNRCHYWSNFEIANLDFFRSRDYQDLFEYLDRKGGFYFERWGDAPVHSLATQMLLAPEKIHHFEDVGYRHDWWYQCPANAAGGQRLESTTLGNEGIWYPEQQGGIGCRCECDGRTSQNHPSFCLHKLKQPTTTKRLSTWTWLWSRFF